MKHNIYWSKSLVLTLKTAISKLFLLAYHFEFSYNVCVHYLLGRKQKKCPINIKEKNLTQSLKTSIR